MTKGKKAKKGREGGRKGRDREIIASYKLGKQRYTKSTLILAVSEVIDSFIII